MDQEKCNRPNQHVQDDLVINYSTRHWTWRCKVISHVQSRDFSAHGSD